jgi:integrase
MEPDTQKERSDGGIPQLPTEPAPEPTIRQKVSPSTADLDEMAKELGLGKKKDVPVPPHFEKVAAISDLYSRADDRMLYLWLYLTGQRVSEALLVKREHILVREVEGNTYLVVDSTTLKNNDRPRRFIPIPFNGLEKDMVESVWAAVNTLKPEAKLFTLTRQMARNHLARVAVENEFINRKTKERYSAKMSIYPHYLRHCRATHMAEEYDYDLYRLMNFFGWKSPTMPNLYCAPGWRNLARGFIIK